MDSLSFDESEIKKAPADQPGKPPTDQTKSAAAAQPLRSDFRETAFFLPDLRLDEKGEVAFEFEVPDSLTEWQLWALALTDDLRGGTLEPTTLGAAPVSAFSFGM
ncbi:MAG: hypothetical protein HC933_18900 [Pleurocapsa sp. SU_196_0]|nr:hypothetical protein [Pleurocapsa sp. SU_196_0]